MHVRVDSGLYAGYRVPPYYDSMIGKLIVYGTHPRRLHPAPAAARSRSSWSKAMKTTIPLHQALVDDPEFLAGNYTIKWLEQWLAKQEE